MTDKKGIENICKTVKENIKDFANYDTTKVEFQIYADEDNFTLDVFIDSEGYDDGEVIFIDCYY